MATFKNLIRRDTPMIKMYITATCDTMMHGASYTVHKKAYMNTNFEGRPYGIKEGDISIGEYDDKKVIISPFEITIRLKEEANHWKEPLSRHDPEYIQLLQDEIDKVFRSDARKAAMIIDQKSYDETQERYMFAPIMISDEFRSRYCVKPLLMFNEQDDGIKSFGFGNRYMLGLFLMHPEDNFYIIPKNENKLGVPMLKSDDNGYHAAYPPTELFALNEVEDIAKWGLLGKTGL